MPNDKRHQQQNKSKCHDHFEFVWMFQTTDRGNHLFLIFAELSVHQNGQRRDDGKKYFNTPQNLLMNKAKRVISDTSSQYYSR
jgi:hypothetical protein